MRVSDLKIFDEDPKEPLKNFIDGEFVSARETMDSIDPSTGKVWVKIPRSKDEDVNLAVKAAKAAFPSWSSSTVQYRSSLLMKVAEIVEKNLEKIAILESRDQGKPINLAKRIDLPRCVHNFRFFATAILHHTAPSSHQDVPIRALNYVKHDPIGVAGLISPWNLPLYLLSFKLAPALATGNTVVFKPSELTSVTAWVLMHAFDEAGFPPGVVNMVIGTGAEAGEPLVIHPDVPLVSFTGSTIVGKRIGALCAAQNKKVSLEMGGKNACIVYPSTDLEKAVPMITTSSFINQGEICLCSSRVYVHETIFDNFLEKYVANAKKFTVGDPRGDFTLGAINSELHYNKVMSYIDLAVKEGGTIHCGGKVNVDGDCHDGYFIAPTIITGLDEKSKCVQDEIFGPVVCVMSFKTKEEVIDRANATPYGLSACVFSALSDELHNTASQLRVGTVWCNTWLTRDLNMPFGGTKQSGMGREGATDSFHFFTEQKTICIALQ
ncbi:unnamed protein product, partial [Mesorhabditis belari]|uniref:Aldehyde dehydrogenase domain-containing protein n=1 Tax=Mesorhabditis belari TaxID=2138241 RepID=A0AAF3EEK1_9BILA